MKQFFTFLITLLVFAAVAQTNQGELPRSFSFNNLTSEIDSRIIAKPDMDQIHYLDSMDVRMGHPYRIAVNIPVNINMNNSGTWTNLPDNSGRIWRLSIASADARALGLYFSYFFIPAGSELFLYNENKKQVVGAFTEAINPESGLYATELVQGEKLTMEYFEPYGATQEAILDIEEMEYVYRGELNLNPDLANYKSSGDCQVNIICSPEGTNWVDESKGVCLLEVKIGSNTFLCSGSLLSNTIRDCVPYVLTADHCSYDNSYATAANMNQWKFYFHYQSSTCGGTSPSGTVIKTGCSIRAHDSYGSGGSGSDFYLVKLNQSISTNNFYYNGWSRSTTASSSGVGIHHPAGDIMKISTYTSALTSPYSTHWRVVWAATTNGHGVTEEGSSGSPIFNSTGLVVGTLTGGSSFCTAPTDPDYYGKFSYHWASNGSTSDRQLKPWLDPNNSNPTTLTGSYTCTVSAVEESNLLNASISIFPNPASDHISIYSVDKNIKNPVVKIYSLVGTLIYTKSFSGPMEAEVTIDTHLLPQGLYFLSLQSGINTVTRKFVIQR
jgi:hypothetical protein